jgi:uncharacterized membrane protein YphA (DoxX/SURF4 family)
MTSHHARLPIRVLTRWCLAPLFVIAGAEAARAPGARAEKAEHLGLPVPELATRANGGLMVVAGGALALGYHPRLAALALAGSLVPTTLAGHAFWEESDPKAISAQRVQFLKNLALLGGLLLVATDH